MAGPLRLAFIVLLAAIGLSSGLSEEDRVEEYRRRGHSLQEAIEVFHNNPCRFLGQNPKFDIKPIRVETAS